MCRRNLNANIVICNNVEYHNGRVNFSGVDNRISFEVENNTKLVSREFHAVVFLTAVFSQNSGSATDDILANTTYDFALAYYDRENSRNVTVCDFQHEFCAENGHNENVSFSTYKVDVAIAEGHIVFNYHDADYIDLVLLVRPHGEPNARWTRQTVERIYIQTI